MAVTSGASESEDSRISRRTSSSLGESVIVVSVIVGLLVWRSIAPDRSLKPLAVAIGERGLKPRRLWILVDRRPLVVLHQERLRLARRAGALAIPAGRLVGGFVLFPPGRDPIVPGRLFDRRLLGRDFAAGGGCGVSEHHGLRSPLEGARCAPDMGVGSTPIAAALYFASLELHRRPLPHPLGGRVILVIDRPLHPSEREAEGRIHDHPEMIFIAL